MKYITLLLLLTISTYARVGETQSEISARLGPVRLESKHYVLAQGQIVELGKALFFQKDDWSIQCDMIGSVCGQISYTKKGEWTEEQKQTLLSNNSSSAKWRETSDSNKMIRKWTRSDGGSAIWKFTGSLAITTPVYTDAKLDLEKRLTEKAKKTPEL